MLGEAMDVDSAGEWRYITDIHGYTIHTYVELDGRHPDVSYWHYLLFGSRRLLPYSISLLSWLGISNTKWRIVSEAEAEFAADQIAHLAKYFIEVVPQLTNGLCIDS
jgi:hypothetical protein